MCQLQLEMPEDLSWAAPAKASGTYRPSQLKPQLLEAGRDAVSSQLSTAFGLCGHDKFGNL